MQPPQEYEHCCLVCPLPTVSDDRGGIHTDIIASLSPENIQRGAERENKGKTDKETEKRDWFRNNQHIISGGNTAYPPPPKEMKHTTRKSKQTTTESRQALNSQPKQERIRFEGVVAGWSCIATSSTYKSATCLATLSAVSFLLSSTAVSTPPHPFFDLERRASGMRVALYVTEI